MWLLIEPFRRANGIVKKKPQSTVGMRLLCAQRHGTTAVNREHVVQVTCGRFRTGCRGALVFHECFLGVPWSFDSFSFRMNDRLHRIVTYEKQIRRVMLLRYQWKLIHVYKLPFVERKRLSMIGCIWITWFRVKKNK